MNYTVKVKWLGRKTVYGKWSSNRYNVNKLYYVRGGICHAEISGVRQDLKCGMLYLIPAGSEISPVSLEEAPLDHSYADFELIPPIAKDGLYALDPNLDNLTRAAADVLISTTETENFGCYFSELSKENADLLNASVLFLLSKFMTANDIPETKYDDVAMSMLKDISENIQSGITVEMLAKKYFMTPESVIRKFKRAFNVTPIAYLRYLRLSTASYYLGTGKKLSEVAHEVGYADPSSLLHAMKREERRGRAKK